MAAMGGERSFAEACPNDEVAPIADLPALTPERVGSIESECMVRGPRVGAIVHFVDDWQNFVAAIIERRQTEINAGFIARSGSLLEAYRAQPVGVDRGEVFATASGDRLPGMLSGSMLKWRFFGRDAAPSIPTSSNRRIPNATQARCNFDG